MKEIRMWQVGCGVGKPPQVTDIESVNETETEQLLEDILVLRPDLLMQDLRLVGRQTDTPGGPLDLLGVDGEGRLVVFELKRGTLTRDAVAQILDYTSFLSELEPSELSKHISERSGQHGIEDIPDFSAWYQEQFAESLVEPQTPRLVLVGLGVDDRARRMVSFLAKGDVDITLITFHAFEQDGKVYLARQVEVEARPPDRSVTASKAGNLAKLKERVERLGLSGYYYDMARLVQQQLSAYEWPNRSGYSYYLPEITESGKESNRVYMSLYLHDSGPGKIQLFLHPRAVEAARLGSDGLPTSLSQRFQVKDSGSAELWLRSQQDWNELAQVLTETCSAIVAGWKEKRTRAASSAETGGSSEGASAPETSEGT